jgi:hypothetical protein
MSRKVWMLSQRWVVEAVNICGKMRVLSCGWPMSSELELPLRVERVELQCIVTVMSWYNISSSEGEERAYLACGSRCQACARVSVVVELLLIVVVVRSIPIPRERPPLAC